MKRTGKALDVKTIEAAKKAKKPYRLSEAAEKALAHEQANKVVAAYARSDLFERRRPLMAAWAEHCLGAANKAATRKASQRGRHL